MAVQSYRQLIVWQKAMELVKDIYYLTNRFPKDETYGLLSQTGGRRFRFRQTLPKDKEEIQRKNSSIIFRSLTAL